MILGESAGVHRFRDKDAYARFTGTAPIPVWSDNTTDKVRLNRGGNRTNVAAARSARTRCASHSPSSTTPSRNDLGIFSWTEMVLGTVVPYRCRSTGGGKVTQFVANAAVLALARESRGLTQVEVSSAMSDLAGEAVSQAFVSKAEAGRLAVSGNRLNLYAAALHYPIEVLCADPEVHGVGIGLVYHRRKASLGAKALRRVHAELMFTRSQLRALQTALGPATHRFYRAERGPMDIPAEIAQRVRKEWDLPSGPIVGLVEAVEAAGGLAVARDLDADGLDAVTQWTGGEPPLFLIDLKAPTDRFRFSLAHEIGHVFLHGEVGGGQEIEREADEFASELLLPASDIRDSFAGSVDLQLLIDLKHYWGASMSALVRRALTLGAISDWQYRQLMVEMSALGYRNREPGTLPNEIPRLVRHLAQQLVRSTGSVESAAGRVGLLPDEFHDLYLSPSYDVNPVEPS